jgi:hypothetical protein
MYFIHTMFKAVDDFLGYAEEDNLELVDVEEEEIESGTDGVSEPVSKVPEPSILHVAIEVSEPAIVEPAVSEKKTIKNRFADFISKYFGCAATSTVAP